VDSFEPEAHVKTVYGIKLIYACILVYIRRILYYNIKKLTSTVSYKLSYKITIYETIFLKAFKL
jgi:hypothetical protein